MSVARRFAAAFAVVGLGVLAYAVPASATESSSSEGCLTNPTPEQFVSTMQPRNGIARVGAQPGLNLCADVWLSVYKVPDTWVGTEFNDTAIPQQLLDSTKGHVTGTDKQVLKVAVPTCGAVQIDLYTPPEITEVKDLTGHNGHLIKGFIWRWYVNGKPLLCTPEGTPTPTPTTESPTPTPTETSESPTPTPTETTESPTPTPTETESTPAPVATTPLGAVIPPRGATPGPIVEVPTAPAPAAAPVLASTGSNATLPLVGFGGALLVAGVGLSVLGRRRTA
jgi:hypothetical protein